MSQPRPLVDVVAASRAQWDDATDLARDLLVVGARASKHDRERATTMAERLAAPPNGERPATLAAARALLVELERKNP